MNEAEPSLGQAIFKLPPRAPGPFSNNPIKPGLPKVPRAAPPSLPGFAKTPPAVPQSPMLRLIQGMQADKLYGPAEKFTMPASRASQVASGIGNVAKNVIKTPGLGIASVGMMSNDVVAQRRPGLYNPQGALRSQQDPYLGGEKVIKPDSSYVPNISGHKTPINVLKTNPIKQPINPSDEPKVDDIIQAGAKSSVAPSQPPVSSLPTEPAKAPEPQTPAPPAAAPREPLQPVEPTKPDKQTASPPKPSAPASAPAERNSEPSRPKKSFNDIRQNKEAPSGPSWVNDMGNGGALQNRSRVFGSDAGG